MEPTALRNDNQSHATTVYAVDKEWRRVQSLGAVVVTKEGIEVKCSASVDNNMFISFEHIRSKMYAYRDGTDPAIGFKRLKREDTNAVPGT